MRHIFVFLLVVCVSALLPRLAVAQVDRELSEMFNGMSNYSSPGAHMGVRRGVITGGGFQFRTDVVRPGALISLDPPSLTGGCGGIDLFGGALSSVSKQAFEDYLRAIVAAAPGYFFQLGLKQICPTCEDAMTKLGNVVREFGFQLQNSCEMARGLITAPMATAQNTAADAASAFGRLGTSVRDIFTGWGEGGDSDTSPTNALAQENPERASDLLGGNGVWRVLGLPGVAGWFGAADAQTKAEIMSLIGTLIECSTEQQDCERYEGAADGWAPVRFQHKPPVLSLRHLVNGSGPDNAPVSVYRCVDTDKCLTMETEYRTNFIGLRSRIEEIYIGPPGQPELGLIQQFARDEGEPTDEQKAIMSAQGQFATMAVRLAKRSPDAARDFVLEHSERIAADVVGTYLKQVFQALRVAIAGWNHPFGDRLAYLVGEADLNAVRDRETLYQMTMAHANSLAHFESLERLMGPREMPSTAGAVSR